MSIFLQGAVSLLLAAAAVWFTRYYVQGDGLNTSFLNRFILGFCSSICALVLGYLVTFWLLILWLELSGSASEPAGGFILFLVLFPLGLLISIFIWIYMLTLRSISKRTRTLKAHTPI